MEILNPLKTDSRGEYVGDVSEAGKRRYASPKLELYGAVRMLTAAAGISTTENVSGNGLCSQNLAMSCIASDRQLKENLVRIGTHPLGIGLYLFDFREQHRERMGQDRQFGVMADEVEKVLPQAVARHADGYKMVNYGMLGIQRTGH